ncbi:hypothetical protein ISE1_2714 [plant metagenome]|uniref:Uncharacterized protein n=1 Tax=plant metagenome TaxID=1297885 RepID=A0A484U346_9ZZZZ
MSEHNAFGTVAMQVFLCHQNPEDTCLRHLDVSLPAMLEGNHV